MKTLILTIIIICTQLINIKAQVQANFNADITEGCNSIVVTFENLSSPPAGLTYLWDFGNGSTSTFFEPTVAYTLPGSYTVKLIVFDGVEYDTLIKENYINVYSQPQVNIDITGEDIGCAPHNIQFLDNSLAGSGSIVQWYWDFGDGTISTEQNPFHTFYYQSDFSVSLIVTDDNNCTGIGSYENLISVFKPAADFLADPVNSCMSSLEVNFYNNSEGFGELTFEWDFGDGSTSDETHPVHTYNSNGNYSVKLITTDELLCSDTVIRENYIVLSGVNAEFTVERDTLCPNEDLLITNLSENAKSYLWDFGDGTFSEAENPVHSYSLPGNYEVTLTADHVFGCVDTYSIMINVEDVTADFYLSDEFSCEIPVSIEYYNNSQNAVSYEWHFGNGEISYETNPVIVYNKKGVYSDTLIAVSSHGCRAEKIIENSLTILLPRAYFKPNMWVDPWDIKGCAPLTVNFTDESVYQTEYDEITNYHWSFGDGSQSNEENPTHIFNDVGVYNVSYFFETQRGCVSTSYYAKAKVGTEQTADFIKNLPDTICASQAIQFFDKSQDSTLINEWYWRFGDDEYSLIQDPVHTYVDTGYMDVKLQAYYNGCGVAEEKKNFVYVKGPIVKVDYNVECDNPYDAFLNSNAIGVEKVYWDFGDGSPVDSININPKHTYPNNEDYTVNLIAVNNSNNCSFSSSKTLYIRDIKADFNIGNSIGCENLQVKLSSEACQDEYYSFESSEYGIYLWDFGDGNKLLTNSVEISHIYKNKGNYSLKLLVSDIRGCKDSLIKEVKIFKPEPDFNADDLIGCMPMEVTFNNLSESDTAIVSWEWDFGDNTTSSDENPVHSYGNFGTFDVTLTAVDLLGCIGTINKNNYIEAFKPIPDFTADDNTICLGDTISFFPQDTSNIISYQWDFGDGSSSKDIYPKHKYKNSGYYSVTLTLIDEQGCDSTQIINNFIYIQDIPVPEFTSSGVFADCYPFQVNFIDSTDNSDVIDWYWSFGDGETSSHLTNPIHIYTSPGSYDVSLNVITENGCTGKHTEFNYIEIKGPVAVINAPDTVCRNEEALFIAEDQEDVFGLQWIFGDGSTSSEDTAYHSYDNIGYMYPILLLKSDDLGTCDKYLTDSLYIPQLLPEIIVVDNLYSDCVPFEFNAYNNCTEADTWFWDFGDGSYSSVSDPVHTYPNANIYTVRLIITDNFGCSDSSEVLIEAFPLPVITPINDTLICRGDEIQLKVSGAENYNWLPKMYLDDQYANMPNSKPDSTITYIVTGTDINGCINNSSLTLTVQQEPQVNINDTAVIIGEQVILDAYSNDILTYEWFPDYELSCNDCPVITAIPMESTLYEITVTDTAECFSLTYDVFIDIIKEYTVDVPAAFTPNGDGINDMVFVRGWGVDNLILFKIFNRYGEIVFETTDKFIGWDGTYKGEMQGVETYTYFVSVETYENEILTKRGTIKLLK